MRDVVGPLGQPKKLGVPNIFDVPIAGPQRVHDLSPFPRILGPKKARESTLVCHWKLRDCQAHSCHAACLLVNSCTILWYQECWSHACVSRACLFWGRECASFSVRMLSCVRNGKLVHCSFPVFLPGTISVEEDENTSHIQADNKKNSHTPRLRHSFQSRTKRQRVRLSQRPKVTAAILSTAAPPNTATQHYLSRLRHPGYTKYG